MRLPLLLAVAGLLVAGTGSVAADTAGPGTLTLQGAGGQAAVLEVTERALTLDYRLDRQPRVPGPDGAVGGLLVQRLPDRSLYGAVLLTNAPGFDGAAGLGLVGGTSTRLPRGRYALTLLGSGPQRIALDVTGRDGPTDLRATGPARSITNASYGAGPMVHDFSTDFSIGTPSTLLAMSIGSGGGLQQASARQWCLTRAESREDVCLFPRESRRSTSIAQTDGAVWETVSLEGGLRNGRYVFAGRSSSASLGSAAHAVVVIDLPLPPDR